MNHHGDDAEPDRRGHHDRTHRPTAAPGSVDAVVIDRLQRVGAARLPSEPDLDAIMGRAARRRRRQQMGTRAATVVVVGGLGLGSLHWLRSTPQTTTVTAVGMLSASAESPAAPPPMAASASGVATTVPDPDRPAESAAGVWSAATEATATAEHPQPTTGALLDDTEGGLVDVEGGTLVHQRASGERIVIDLPGIDDTWSLRITDLAPVNGVPHLLVTGGTDHDDVVAQRTAALYQAYGLTPSAASDPPRDLAGRASTEELDSLVHRELALFAVDLTTDVVHVVERRTIDDLSSADATTYDHVTSDGRRILIVRDLWDGRCVYADALDRDGSPAIWPDSPLERPDLGGLDGPTRHAMRTGQEDPPTGCRNRDELPDGAASVFAVTADREAIATLNQILGGS